MDIIGVDLGDTNIAAALVRNGNIRSRTRELTSHLSSQVIIKQIIDAVERLLRRENLDLSDIDGIGIAVSGLTDGENGRIISAPMLPFKNCELVKELHPLIKTEIRIENHGACTVLGEHTFGDFKELRNIIMINVESRISGGIIRYNKLVRGVGAAELGHISLDSQGEICSCGKRGCADGLISATALLQLSDKIIRINPGSKLFKADKFDCEEIFKEYAAHDTAAIKIVNIYMENFINAILAYLRIYGDSDIIVGGGIANAGRAFFETLNSVARRSVIAPTYGMRTLKIHPASLGENGGIYGAAALFEEESD